ncbi:GTP-binding protein rbg1 [Tilletia horrida]|nr:GTP-binding protein rbg1 [Tilletia horrida]
MAKTQKNKATSYHLGQLRAKLAKLQRELISPSSGGGGGGGMGFDVARTGIASVVTTVPGTLELNGAKLQILDLPGIIEGAKDGKGRGRQVIAVARTCNLIFIVLDVTKPLKDKQIIENELEGFGIRLNKKPPHILIKKKDKGGLSITNTVPLTKLDHDEVRAVMAEYRMANAEIAFREDASLEQLIDVVEGNRIYIPAIYVLNKIDAISIEELDLLYRIPKSVPISSGKAWNIDELLDVCWSELDLVRVYTRPRGKTPDFSAPVVLKRGRCSVEHFCNAIHREIFRQFNAMVWGTSAKHPRGQRVGGDHILEDGDIVSIVKKAGAA